MRAGDAAGSLKRVFEAVARGASGALSTRQKLNFRRSCRSKKSSVLRRRTRLTGSMLDPMNWAISTGSKSTGARWSKSTRLVRSTNRVGLAMSLGCSGRFKPESLRGGLISLRLRLRVTAWS